MICSGLQNAVQDGLVLRATVTLMNQHLRDYAHLSCLQMTAGCCSLTMKDKLATVSSDKE